jgi:hypothetical protein
MTCSSFGINTITPGVKGLIPADGNKQSIKEQYSMISGNSVPMAFLAPCKAADSKNLSSPSPKLGEAGVMVVMVVMSWEVMNSCSNDSNEVVMGLKRIMW